MEVEPVRQTAVRKMLREFFATPVGLVVYNTCGYAVPAGAAASALALIYLVLAVLTGALAQASTATDASRFTWVGLLLTYGVIALCLALMIRNYEDDSLIVIFGIAGAAVYLGLPMLLQFGLARSADASVVNRSVQILNGQFMFLGLFVWAVAALRACVFAVDRLISGDDAEGLPTSNRDIISKVAARPLKPNVATRKGPFARCWEQPHCIDFIREVCRPYAEKRSCWKLQTGCMCDVRYLYEAMRKDNTMGIRADEGMDDLIPDAESMGGGGHERKLYCKDCRIYLEHQRRKFKVLSPLAVPITIVIVLALTPLFSVAYHGLIAAVGRGIGFMWLTDARETVAQRFVDDMSNQTAVYAALVMFGLFLLSAVMRFIEWMTLEMKL